MRTSFTFADSKQFIHLPPRPRRLIKLTVSVNKNNRFLMLANVTITCNKCGQHKLVTKSNNVYSRRCMSLLLCVRLHVWPLLVRCCRYTITVALHESSSPLPVQEESLQRPLSHSFNKGSDSGSSCLFPLHNVSEQSPRRTGSRTVTVLLSRLKPPKIWSAFQLKDLLWENLIRLQLWLPGLHRQEKPRRTIFQS